MRVVFRKLGTKLNFEKPEFATADGQKIKQVFKKQTKRHSEE